ncbi:MAG: aliphatic sulfonate ABC transporter substrate-binding protein [Eubacteriales bacterium]|nr:aliphatic sulfonate ABC transporter substrate-binding protein [Eubacteriales bacterium]
MMKRKKNKIWLAAAGVIMMAFGLAGCGGEKEKGKPEVHIGYFYNITHAQALYMKSQGILEKEWGEEVSVKWSAFHAGPAEVEALFSGDIDIGYIGPVPAVSANVKSQGDVSVIAGAACAGAELVRAPGADITSVADLDGKTVAVPQIGNTQHLCLLKLLSENGLAPVDEGGTVRVTAVENADVQNLMDQGNIDAAVVPEPWGSTLVKGGAEILLDYDALYQDGNYPVSVVVVRNDFMEEHPDLVETFLEQHEEVTQVIASDTDQAAQVINEEINQSTGKSLEPDILRSAFEKMTVSAEVSEKALREFAQISLEQGFIGALPEDSLVITGDVKKGEE